VTRYDEIAAREQATMMPVFARYPVAFERGSGTKLWDTEGKEYLDFLGGLAVVSLGHAHPEVATAIAEQAATLLHVSNYFSNVVAGDLTARIDELLGGDGRVFLANSGAEANECAIKLARKYGQLHGGPERYHVLGAYRSFHGRTLMTLAATGQPEKHEAFQPLPPGFRHVSFADIDELAAAMDERVCAVILEAIQGEGGVWPAPDGYLEAVRALCDEREVLLIMDEVQTGLGRTGKWFGFEHAGIRPDIVTLAKALGNGMPIGACWAQAHVAAAFVPGDHGSTYGGQPLASRAAVTVLEIMARENVAERAVTQGARLTAALEDLPEVDAVRGHGLLLGAELVEGIDARIVSAGCLAEGLIVNAVTPTALRFAPPLLVTDDEIDAAMAILSRVLDDVTAEALP
jgi:predicted acetylornithine/succinylornithine family transaminase